MMNVGIQSFVLRNWKTHEELIARMKECGVRQIELCSLHFSLDDPGGFEKAVQLYRDHGIAVTGLGVFVFNNDEKTERRYFELARIAGAKCVSAHFLIAHYPTCLRAAEKLAEEFDMRVCLHNKGGRNWTGNKDMIGRILGETGPRIGLCLDTGWAIDANEDPAAIVTAFPQRLYSVHLKDVIYNRTRRPVDVVLGEGNFNVPAFVKALKAAQFDGPIFIEYEGEPQNPVPAVRRFVEVFQKEWQHE